MYNDLPLEIRKESSFRTDRNLLPIYKILDIKNIVSGSYPNFFPLSTSSALHIAARNGLSRVVSGLIKKGADVLLCDKNGKLLCLYPGTSREPLGWGGV